MIILTRLGNGLPIAVNPDLIERAEATPDTVVTMMDGHKLVVEEPLEEVVALIREWRASIAAQAISLAGLTMIPTADELDEDDAELAELAHLADSTAHHAASKGRLLRLPLREV